MMDREIKKYQGRQSRETQPDPHYDKAIKALYMNRFRQDALDSSRYFLL